HKKAPTAELFQKLSTVLGAVHSGALFYYRFFCGPIKGIKLINHISLLASPSTLTAPLCMASIKAIWFFAERFNTSMAVLASLKLMLVCAFGCNPLRLLIPLGVKLYQRAGLPPTVRHCITKSCCCKRFCTSALRLPNQRKRSANNHNTKRNNIVCLQ